jgi:hypothetical protein
MKRIKIIFVISVLSIFILGSLVLAIITYINEARSGKIDSLEEFLVRKNRYLSFSPMILGFIGLLNRTLTGWVFIACVFYLMLFMGVTIGIKSEMSSFFDLSTYLLFMIAIVSPLIIMNSMDFKNHYKIDVKRRLWAENIIAFIAMAILGTGLIVLNG